MIYLEFDYCKAEGYMHFFEVLRHCCKVGKCVHVNFFPQFCFKRSFFDGSNDIVWIFMRKIFLNITHCLLVLHSKTLFDNPYQGKNLQNSLREKSEVRNVKVLVQELKKLTYKVT